MDRDRRRTSDHGMSEPAKLVVGFRVEGQAESPMPVSYVDHYQRGKGGVVMGSPSPVIIPPSFQVSDQYDESSHKSCIACWLSAPVAVPPHRHAMGIQICDGQLASCHTRAMHSRRPPWGVSELFKCLPDKPKPKRRTIVAVGKKRFAWRMAHGAWPCPPALQTAVPTAHFPPSPRSWTNVRARRRAMVRKPAPPQRSSRAQAAAPAAPRRRP